MNGKLEDPAKESRKSELQHGDEHDIQIVSVLLGGKDEYGSWKMICIAGRNAFNSLFVSLLISFPSK